ncbi:hypothetical protein [Halorientalis regularis]|uniref:CHAT domain-containing protein n=1 Tax=Halorientalis regularis TaxID=660518 RepID=A0A1G7NLQ6_9EURY|nr:hypothetical protein [Halorientalis regularis]SDF74892.1 hypothetical protein SAMN05216218_10951 [Halorientalis regularis]
MMAWVAANGGVRAIGGAGEATVRTVDWEDRTSGPELVQPVEDCVTGSLSELRVPVENATLTDASGGRRYDLIEPVALDRGQFLLDCRLAVGGGRTANREPSMELYCRFDGPAFVRRVGEQVVVSLGEERPVTLGFREHCEDPSTVTVPPTPAGVADAISRLSAALRTTGPARSHPSMRDHPPVVEVGDERSIPDAVDAATPETGIELRLPESLEYLFVGAPLAYYLGATVTVEPEATPKLVAPSADVECRFRELPTFQHGVARLLRQVFFYDTLVRDLEGESPARRDALLDRFDLDPATLRRRTPAQRLARYFCVTEPDFDEYLPEWHFSTYAAPELDNVRSLPYLLDALSLIYLPESSELRGTELLERTLDDFYRSGSHASRRSVASVDRVDPELRAGRIHAWLAGGAPIDAFKTSPQAYENRRRYQDRRGTPLSVTVVLNDEEMYDEHAAVADIYQERSADLPLSVDIEEHLTSAELAEVFASPNDFVHYIGHCDADGLECPDGRFTASSLDSCETRTFFLNACGSYHEGLELIERGSVGGAVTLTRVLDRQAAKVGTAFSRLLVHGFGLEPAMQLSRRRIMMGKDYAVVGDGTYTLAPTPDSPVVGWLERDDGRFRLSCEALTARRIGDCFQPAFGEASSYHGTATETVLTRDELVDVLSKTPLPIIYDNEFHWSDDLATELAASR